jgi:alkylation response protein AidB-like acyl-CoA dehydrogenase
MFALPMDRPGLTVRPIVQVDGEAKFNQVFLDNVHFDPGDVLGAVDDGWRVLGSAVGRERLTIGAQAAAQLRVLEEVRVEARRCGRWREPIFRQRVAQLWTRASLLQLTFRRLIAVTDGLSDPRLSALKLMATELQQAVSLLAGDLWGVALVTGQHDAADRILTARGATIAGGTSEIQRNILAERVLGLPRERPRKDM